MKFIKSEDQNGYATFTIQSTHGSPFTLVRGLEVREWSKVRGDYLVHYMKYDRCGEPTVWIHNAGGLVEFNSAEECKKDLVKRIRASAKEIIDSLLTESD